MTRPDFPRRCTAKEKEVMETSCDKNQLLLDIKMMVPILRVMQEDRDHMALAAGGRGSGATAMKTGFRGREGSVDESCLSTWLVLAQEETNEWP